MNYFVGLGNPDEKYIETRHNMGRDILLKFAKKHKLPEFIFDKKSNALISEGEYIFIKEGRKTKTKVPLTLILPETYMNNSGLALKKIISNKKNAENLTVIYDDLDLGIGTTKMNFNKGTGGHKGLESIIINLKTKEFNRIRIGISPITPARKIKKPKGEEKVVKHVLGKFSPKENEVINKIKNQSIKGIEMILELGRVKATNLFN